MRNRVPAASAAVIAAVALVLTGCGGGSSKPAPKTTTAPVSTPAAPDKTAGTSAATTAPSADPSTDSPTTDSPSPDSTSSDTTSSGMFADPGCNEAMDALQSVSKLSGVSDPKSALAALHTMVSQLRDAASKAKSPAAAAGINKLADDFQSMISSVEAGNSSVPDNSAVMKDGKAMAIACES
jgi:hypothetical protein